MQEGESASSCKVDSIAIEIDPSWFSQACVWLHAQGVKGWRPWQQQQLCGAGSGDARKGEWWRRQQQRMPVMMRLNTTLPPESAIGLNKADCCKSRRTTRVWECVDAKSIS